MANIGDDHGCDERALVRCSVGFNNHGAFVAGLVDQFENLVAFLDAHHGTKLTGLICSRCDLDGAKCCTELCGEFRCD